MLECLATCYGTSLAAVIYKVLMISARKRSTMFTIFIVLLLAYHTKALI